VAAKFLLTKSDIRWFACLNTSFKFTKHFCVFCLLHFAWVIDDGKCIVVTSVCVCVCLSVCGRTPTLLHGPGCNLAAWYRLPPSCALLGGFAIGARAALLWQHNGNPSYKLASSPRYDIVRTLGGSVHADGQWLAGDGGRVFWNLCAVYGKWASLGEWVSSFLTAHQHISVAGWAVTGRRQGAFSTLLRRPGLRASTAGVLAT